MSAEAKGNHKAMVFKELVVQLSMRRLNIPQLPILLGIRAGYDSDTVHYARIFFNIITGMEHNAGITDIIPLVYSSKYQTSDSLEHMFFQ